MNPSGMMVNSVTITSPTYTTASSGAHYVSGTTTATSVASIQPRGSTEGSQYGRESGTVNAVGYFPASASIPMNSTVTLGSAVYRVKGAARDVGGRGVYQEVDLELET